MYSATGRGIPDISAQAHKFLATIDTNPVFLSGTSCATPVRLTPRCLTLRLPSPSIQLISSIQTVAGIIALLNDFLLSEGEPPLGWLNPWLYGQGQFGLNDITGGSNRGCGGKYGFSAVRGWDPVRSSARFIYSFRRWLTLGLLTILGHGPWDAGLF